MKQDINRERRLLSQDEFWHSLGGSLGRGTIRKWVREGKIKSITVGRKHLIPAAELDEFIEREASGNQGGSK